jgi:hypothetical protein
VEVVLPAGNNDLSRCHAELALAPGSVQTLNWRVLPDDWTESYLDIWMPGGGAAGPPVQIAVTAPDGARSGWIQAGAQLQLKIAGNTVVAQVSFYPPLYVGPQAVVRISMAPTASPRAGVPLAMPGLWRISVRNTGHLPVSPIHTWIERDDAAPGYKRAGAQSYLDDPAYGRYDDGGRPIVNDNDPRTINSHVKRRHTLNAIASGGSPIVIGGFRHGGKPEHEAWSGSSRGPALPPGRANGVPGWGPDAMYRSEDSPSHHGVLGAGTRSGSCVAMNGTSVAAPLAVRRIVDSIVSPSPSNPTPLIDRAKVFNDAGWNDPGGGNQPPAELGGGGRVLDPPPRERGIEWP